MEVGALGLTGQYVNNVNQTLLKFVLDHVSVRIIMIASHALGIHTKNNNVHVKLTRELIGNSLS